jgi:hypothetical protein
VQSGISIKTSGKPVLLEEISARYVGITNRKQIDSDFTEEDLKMCHVDHNLLSCRLVVFVVSFASALSAISFAVLPGLS